MRVRSGKPCFLFLLLLSLSGCSRHLGDDRLTWVWGLAPLAFFGLLGTSWFIWQRKDQLAKWDLRTHPLPPEDRFAVGLLSGLAGVAAVGFAVATLMSRDVETWQGMKNAFFWLAGSTAAVGLAMFAGRKLAERGYPKREDGNG